MAENFSIDLDNERVLVDEVWYTRESLALHIREMVQGGDFHVTRPSAALEALEAALANLALFTVRLRPEVISALNGAAVRSNKTAESLAREILGRGLAVGSVAAPAAAPTPPPIPLTASVAERPPETPVPIALTPKKAAGAAALSDAEQGWFNRR